MANSAPIFQVFQFFSSKYGDSAPILSHGENEVLNSDHDMGQILINHQGHLCEYISISEGTFRILQMLVKFIGTTEFVIQEEEIIQDYEKTYGVRIVNGDFLQRVGNDDSGLI